MSALNRVAGILVLIGGILAVIGGILGLLVSLGLGGYIGAEFGGGLVGSILTLILGILALYTWRALNLEMSIALLVIAILTLVFGSNELGEAGAALVLVGAIIALIVAIIGGGLTRPHA